LVEYKHHQRERGDAAIGFLKNGIGVGHKDSFKFRVSRFKSEPGPMREAVRTYFGLWTLV
jgi:hypothetical protein